MSRGLKKKLVICGLAILLILFVIFALPAIRAVYSANRHFQTETITAYFSETTNKIRQLDENIEDVRVTYVRSLPSITITVYWSEDTGTASSWNHDTLENMKNLIAAEKDVLVEGYEAFEKEGSDINPITDINLAYAVSGSTEADFTYAYDLADNQWHINHGEEVLSSVYAS